MARILREKIIPLVQKRLNNNCLNSIHLKIHSRYKNNKCTYVNWKTLFKRCFPLNKKTRRELEEREEGVFFYNFSFLGVGK